MFIPLNPCYGITMERKKKMKVYKCDRCGKELAEADTFRSADIDKLVYFVTCEGVREHIHYELCEQCYTTIKEVLEDGEIK